MARCQVCKLPFLFIAVGVPACFAIREPETTEGGPETTEGEETHKYTGDVFLTLYKDGGCNQLREHHRIRPGQCVKTNEDSGIIRNGRNLAKAVGLRNAPFDHAWLSENGELYMCQDGCESQKCSPVPVAWPEHECVSEPGMKIGEFISSVRVGYPDASLQFFETSECVDWFEKRRRKIWQHDVFFDDCFETKFHVMDNKFDFAKITSEWEVYFCTNKMCDSCNLAPRTYKKNVCIDPSYVGQSPDREHNAIRIKPYEVTEASTVLDDPRCVERVASIHTAKDAIKAAQTEMSHYFQLGKSCPVPKQNMDLRGLFPKLEDALRVDSAVFAADKTRNYWVPAKRHNASAAEAQSSDLAKSEGPHVLVTSYKDKECTQVRGHVKVTEKCTQLIPQLKRGEYQHAIIKLGRLMVCQPGCVTCRDPDEETTACTEIGRSSDYIKAVRIGDPEYSFQFFEDPGCPNWHDKRDTRIWQHDMFLNNCFKTYAPIGRKDLKFALLKKDAQGVIVLQTCLDKACHKCQPSHYKFNECEDASYVGMPKDAQHTALRMKAWELSESATIYDRFPECRARVMKVHRVMDLVKEATAKVDASKSLEEVCKSPKQDEDLFELGKRLRNALTDLRPNTGERKS